MTLLLDADVIIRLWKVNAGALLGDIARMHPLAMTAEVHDEIMDGTDSWLPKLRASWNSLESASLATTLTKMVGDSTHEEFLKLASKYAPRVKDLTTPFENSGDLVNIAWLLTRPDLVYVTEDHGARYRGFLEATGVPSQITTPWAVFRSTYSGFSISTASLALLRRWDKEKAGPPQRPIWWPSWLASLVPAP